MGECCSSECIISENISGYIDLKDQLFHVIWQAIDIDASITIKIKNLSKNVINLEIERKRCVILKVFPNDEKNVTIPNVKKIAVQCSDADNETPCQGNYQIIIHYPLEFTRCKDGKKDTCNEFIGWSNIKNYMCIERG